MEKNIGRGVSSYTAIIGLTLFLMIQPSISQAQDVVAGEQVFQTLCFACHGIGEAQRVGPDLANVHDRRTQSWLEQFVKSSQTLVNSGDADAVAVFEQFNKIVMPDAALSDQQIIDVLGYIQSRSANLVSTVAQSTASVESPVAEPEPVTIEPPSDQDIAMGRNLFQGLHRFDNSGPACNACHDVQSSSVAGGGSLAVELSDVYSRYGGAAGLNAIISQSPFPAMKVAYNTSPLTEEEVAFLIAFLQHADPENSAQEDINYGLNLFLTGVLGVIVLFVLFPFIWRGRKIGSVNQLIYDRQTQ